MSVADPAKETTEWCRTKRLLSPCQCLRRSDKSDVESCATSIS